MVHHTGGDAQLDVVETLRLLYKNSVRTSRNVESSTHAGVLIDFDAVEKKLARASKFSSLITGVLGFAGSVFVAGMVVAAFKDKLATDDDINSAIIQHNEVDPAMRDPATLQEVGTHPMFRRRLDDTTEQLKTNTNDIDAMKRAQLKIDRRNEYQFEFARWQAKVTECERTKRCKPPARPARLDQLELELILGFEP